MSITEPIRNRENNNNNNNNNNENKILGEHELSFNCAVLIPARAQSNARILERASDSINLKFATKTPGNYKNRKIER